MTVPPAGGRRFRALLAAEPDGTPARFVERTEADLEDGDVTIEVAWSSLNYKDALAITGSAPVVRKFPLVCGIDLAGRVVASASSSVPTGSHVVVTGCGLGEDRDGGYSGMARVPGAWCVVLGSADEARRAVAIGTAGLTAMLCVLALERNGLLDGASAEDRLPVLVTGAAGGVGSFAVAILAGLGLRVVASTGRPEEASYLHDLGAAEILDRQDLLAGKSRPLDKERYAGAVDVVGGATLARVLSQIRHGGAVAACGLAGGADLATTVHPFILRGVTLAGVNAVWPAPPVRIEAWRRLGEDVPAGLIEEIANVVALDDVRTWAPELLAGRVRGRLVVEVGGGA